MYQFLPLTLLKSSLMIGPVVNLNPAKLDLFGLGKSIMSGVVIQCLRHINDISNSDLVKNADVFLD